MIVNIRLNLPKIPKTIVLRYNTFDKVSYDKYLVASILKQTRDNTKINNLINDLTGKGSLNSHFKKLYEEIKVLSQKEIEDIVNDSLYPIQKIEECRYLYIPMLNISLFKGDLFKGDLALNDNLIKQLVEVGGLYISHDIQAKELVSKADNYLANLSDDKIEIKIENQYFPISQENFQEIVIKEDIYLDYRQGKIYNAIDGDGWMQLTKSTIHNISESSDFFYDEGDHFAIYNDHVKKTSIAFQWGIYWIKETSYKYQDSSSRSVCEKAARVLIESGRINEIKIKSLLDILKNTNRNLQQEIINYVLSKKDVKDLALNGLILIDKGYEKGWNDKATQAFYKFKETEKHLLLLYKVNPNLKYTIDDLLTVYKLGKTILSNEHNKEVESYYNDYDQIIKSIHEKIGILMSSGLRDNIGKMTLDDNSKKLRKFFKDLAHFENDIKDKNLFELQQYLENINKHYKIFQVVQKRWEEEKPK